VTPFYFTLLFYFFYQFFFKHKRASELSNRETEAEEEVGRGGSSMDRDARGDRQVQWYNNLPLHQPYYVFISVTEVIMLWTFSLNIHS